MSEQIRNSVTPNEVVLNLLELSRQLGVVSDSLDKIEDDAIAAREKFTVAHARAFLESEGPMDIRKHEAILATSNERLAADVAEATVRAAKRKLDTLKIRVDVGRSAAAAVRAEAEFLRVR